MDLFIVPEECSKLLQITLPRPKDGQPQNFFYDEENLALYEVVQYKDQFRSWFVDNSLCQDGHFNMLTKIDPLYIFVAQLMKLATEQYRPLNDICQEFSSHHEQTGDSMSRLDYALTPYINWQSICDTKDLDGELFVRFSEANTIDWLVKKHERVMGTLKGQLGEQASRATLLSYSLDIIDEYIPVSLSPKFKHAVRDKQMIVSGGSGLERKAEVARPRSAPRTNKPQQIHSTGSKRTTGGSPQTLPKPTPPKNSIANFFIKKNVPK